MGVAGWRHRTGSKRALLTARKRGWEQLTDGFRPEGGLDEQRWILVSGLVEIEVIKALLGFVILFSDVQEHVVTMRT